MEFSQITQLKAGPTQSARADAPARQTAPSDEASPFSDAMARARKPSSTRADETGNATGANADRRETPPRTSGERSDTNPKREKTIATPDEPANRSQIGVQVPDPAQAARPDPSGFPALAATSEPESGLEPVSKDAGSGDPEAMLALLSSMPAFRPLASGDAAPTVNASQAPLAGTRLDMSGRGVANEVRRERLLASLDGDLSTLDSDTGDTRRSRLDPLSLIGNASGGNDTLAGNILTGKTVPTTQALTAGVPQAASGAPSGSAFTMLQTTLPSANHAGLDADATGALGADIDGIGAPFTALTTGNGAPALTPTSTAPAGANIPVAVNSPQWPSALGQQVLQLHQRGEHQMQLHLNPRDLGPLSVTLTVNDQQAQLHALSAHAGVRAAVEAAFPQLREALAASGIALGEATVGDQGQPQEQSDPREGGASRLATPGAAGTSLGGEEALIDTPLRPVALDSAGNINLYA